MKPNNKKQFVSKDVNNRQEPKGDKCVFFTQAGEGGREGI